LIEIINKQLLLQLVGYLCYWQMGFNSVFKGLSWHFTLFHKEDARSNDPQVPNRSFLSQPVLDIPDLTVFLLLL